MLFKEVIPVYIENNAKPINTKCRVTDCQSSWYIKLQLGFKGLMPLICMKLNNFHKIS
jgi:hypothetical protein